jgi:hypothetical protein
MSGAAVLVSIVSAESARELDNVVTTLSIWPRMETEITPLTTFEGRALTLRPRLDELKARGRASSRSFTAERPPLT